MPELGKAYVQIVPSAQGISGSISGALGGEAQSAGASAGNSLGSSLVSTLKGIIVAAGIGSMIKETLSAGGDLQQSFGGLDTIYGDAADAAKKYAAEAQAAGISANEYAENAVSFGASLKQAFEGDTAKAVEAANTAILDMTDNAAKMGTPIESIQTAYQGFAKQNYTMLDNLKLGYGGTKQEMQRLLEDATKLSGVEYNMDNLGDVYEAIHVIQGDLGLTGVAAQEASETFTGSLGAMKAAATNLMANLALGEDISGSLNALGDSMNAFVFNNLVPMLGNIASAIPQLLSGVSGMIIQSLNIVSNNAEDIVNQGIEIVTSLVSAIVEAAPYLLEAAFSLVAALGNALLEADWATIGSNLLSNLKSSLDLAGGEILGTDESIVTSLMEGITTNLPMMLESASEIITGLVNGLLASAPQMITGAGQLLTSFAGFILDNAAILLSTGAGMINNIMSGLSQNLPRIMESAVQVISQFLSTITSKLPELLSAGVEIVLSIVNGILQNLPTMITTAIQLVTEFVSFILQNIPTILQAGADLVLGLVDGIISNLPEIVVAATKGITEYLTTIAGMLPQILQKGIEIIGQLVAGLIQAIPKIIAAIPQIISGISDTLMEFDWMGLGIDILDGIGRGITSATQNIINALWGSVKAAIDWVMSQLHIGSPSKYMADHVGKWMALGIGEGFDDNMPETEMADTVKNTTLSMDTAVNSGIASTSNAISYEAIYQAVKAGAEAAQLEIDIDGRELTRTLRGLGVAMA